MCASAHLSPPASEPLPIGVSRLLQRKIRFWAGKEDDRIEKLQQLHFLPSHAGTEVRALSSRPLPNVSAPPPQEEAQALLQHKVAFPAGSVVASQPGLAGASGLHWEGYSSQQSENGSVRRAKPIQEVCDTILRAARLLLLLISP